MSDEKDDVGERGDTVGQPPGASRKEHVAWYHRVYRETAGFVRGLIAGWQSTSPESRRDAHQNVFTTFFRVTRSVRPENVRGLLYEITENEMLNHVRVAGRRPRCEDESAAEDVPATEIDAEAGMMEDERQAKLDWVMQQLSPSDQAAIALVDLDELSCEEAAKRLGISTEALKKRHARARTRAAKIAEATLDRAPDSDQRT